MGVKNALGSEFIVRNQPIEVGNEAHIRKVLGRRVSIYGEDRSQHRGIPRVMKIN